MSDVAPVKVGVLGPTTSRARTRSIRWLSNAPARVRRVPHVPASWSGPVEVVMGPGRCKDSPMAASARAERVLRAGRGRLRGDLRAVRLGERRPAERLHRRAGRGPVHHDGRDREHVGRVGLRAEQRLDGGGAVIMAAVAKHDGRTSVGIALRAVADRPGVPADRAACVRSTRGCASPGRWRSASGGRASFGDGRAAAGRARRDVPRRLRARAPRDERGARRHRWDPPRYTTTAFSSRTAATCGCSSSRVGSVSSRSTSGTRSGRRFSTSTRRADGERPEVLHARLLLRHGPHDRLPPSRARPRSPARGSRTRWSTSRWCRRPRARPGPTCGSGGSSGRVGSVPSTSSRDGCSATESHVFHGTIEGTLGRQSACREHRVGLRLRRAAPATRAGRAGCRA